MKLKKYLSIMILIPIMMSCTDDYDSNITTPVKEIISMNFGMNDEILGYLYSTSSRTMISSNEFVTKQIHHVYFYDSLNHYNPVNSVLLNGLQISQRDDIDSIVFDGTTNHIWNITGNSYIPSFIDTVCSLNNFTITYPIPDATFNKNNSLTISYTPISGIDTVAIIAKYNLGLSHRLDSTNDTSKNFTNAKIVPNNGTIVLPSSFLQGFSSNTYVTFQIVGCRFKHKLILDKKIQTACVVDCKINYIVQ